MNRIIKQIPNTITSMNLLCGALGVIAAFKGWMDTAFYLMLAGAVCDFCDGLAARLLKAYSPMGKELDSLADLITFGFLPSIMLYKCMDFYHERVVLLHPAHYCSLLRIATCKVQRRR